MSKRRPTSVSSHRLSRGHPRGIWQLIPTARRVTAATGEPVVGGMAVMLYGGAGVTGDIDIYSADRWTTHERLEAVGILWNAGAREHRAGDIGVHMVASEYFGAAPRQVRSIRGVKVVGLQDLVRSKLALGLTALRHIVHIADVIELIGAVPLKKNFAAKLPKHLRAPFKELVDQVHEPRRTPLPTLTFWKKYA